MIGETKRLDPNLTRPSPQIRNKLLRLRLCMDLRVNGNENVDREMNRNVWVARREP